MGRYLKGLLSRRNFLKYGGTLWGMLFCKQPAYAEQAVSFSVSLRQQQDFRGFGVNTWPSSPHMQVRNLVLRDLNVVILRSMTILLPDNMLPRLVSVTSIYDMLRQVYGKKSIKMQAFAEELANLKIKMHALFWNPPLVWQRPVKNNIHIMDGIYIGNFAYYITAHLLYLRDQGIMPIAVELTNEPNGIWNTQFTPEQYDQLVVLTRQALDDAGLNTISIEGPGISGNYQAFMSELKKTGHIDLLSVYSFHEYDSLYGQEPAGLKYISPNLVGVPKRQINVTEFSDAAPRWHTMSGSYAGGNAAHYFDFGVSVAGEALQLISDGAAEVMVWDLEDYPWMKTKFGLIDVDGNIKALGYALISLFGLVEPGSSVFVPTPTLPKVPIVMFTKSTTLTICAVNLRYQSLGVNVNLSSVQFHNEAKPQKINCYSGVSGNILDSALSISILGHGCRLHLPPRTSVAVRLDKA